MKKTKTLKELVKNDFEEFKNETKGYLDDRSFAFMFDEEEIEDYKESILNGDLIGDEEGECCAWEAGCISGMERIINIVNKQRVKKCKEIKIDGELYNRIHFICDTYPSPSDLESGRYATKLTKRIMTLLERRLSK